ncbi:putative bifunctional diguanylate cyclase/phosphodiesterase [Sphingomonas oryzagri]
MVARGASLKATTDRLCVEIEALLQDVVCSVVTVDHGNQLHPLSGPSLPAALRDSISGLVIGPAVGSCGSAVYLKQPIAVTDIGQDPRWEGARDLAIGGGLLACWSSPIIDGEGRALGAFAFYYRERRGPSARERKIVETCVHLCAIAIERHERVVELERRATVDMLTGLDNRASFNAMLSGLSCTAPGRWALLIIDLDHLKTVNDTFGHHAGDQLLEVSAKRIAAAAAPDVPYRLGGDEFVVVVQSSPALQNLDGLAERILAALAEPADCAGYRIMPQATIGGAALAPGEDRPEIVRLNADFALYHAKEIGRGGFVRYWPGLGTTMTGRASATRELDAALRDDRIEAWYQPVLNLETEEIMGFEALCRLRTESGAIKPASMFHAATSDAQIASALTRRMLGIVAADLARWIAMGIPFPQVAINVSSVDFHGMRLETDIRETFEKAGVSVHHLIIEVTESVHLGNPDHVVARTIEKLRGQGLRIALDDFGTGFASLTHLLAVPIDIIKIDQSFVQRLAPGDPSVAIISGLVAIAGALGIRVVAEGIEAEDQLVQLRALGCRFGQGYLFAPALRQAEVTDILVNGVLLPQARKGNPDRSAGWNQDLIAACASHSRRFA